MVDTELGSGCLKKGEKISFTIGKAICKFKTIIRLNGSVKSFSQKGLQTLD